LSTNPQNRFWSGIAIIAAVGFVFGVFDPISWRVFPHCVLYSMTGLYCPGCGTARAFTEIAHCHLFAALRLNAVTVLALPVVGVLWVTGRLDRLKPAWIWTLLVVVVAFGILRNLPWYPFTLLKPHP
jgi:hypothetical protein